MNNSPIPFRIGLLGRGIYSRRIFPCCKMAADAISGQPVSITRRGGSATALRLDPTIPARLGKSVVRTGGWGEGEELGELVA